MNPYSVISTGRSDSSGVRFYYTPNLRQYDAGVYSVGDAVTTFMAIPPKQESWLTIGYCPKECNQVIRRRTHYQLMAYRHIYIAAPLYVDY